MRFQAGDRVVWYKPYGGPRKISKIVCVVLKTNPCTYRLQFRDPLKGVLVRTAGTQNVLPFTGDWLVERENLAMVRYGSLRDGNT